MNFLSSLRLFDLMIPIGSRREEIELPSESHHVVFLWQEFCIWNFLPDEEVKCMKSLFFSFLAASLPTVTKEIYTYIYGRDTSKKSLDQVVLVFFREDDETKETGARKKREEEWREAHHVMKDEGGEEVGKLPWFLLDTRACMCPVLISSGIHLQLPKVPLFLFLSLSLRRPILLLWSNLVYLHFL